MILRKDINMVAYLIQHRIEFKPFNTTVEVDQSKLSIKELFVLSPYKTSRELMRPAHYVKPNKSQYKLRKEKAKRNKSKRKLTIVLGTLGIELVSFEEYRKLYPPPPSKVDFHAKIIDNSQITTRPPAQYSNPQWSKLYED